MNSNEGFRAAIERAEAIVEAWPNIEGWPGQKDSVQLTLSAASFQYAQGIGGTICEIGVHHGKYFLLLDALRRPTETAVALDLFEDQDKNLDKSGSGDRGRFLENLKKYSHDPDAVRIIAGDSLEISPDAILKAGGDQVRLFSVDGGHTARHAENDIMKAEQVLCDYGVVIVDDYFDPAWAGVHVGAVKYLTSGKSDLVPFAASRKKLYLCKRAAYREFFDHCATDKDGFFKSMRIRRAVYDDLPMLAIAPA